ncbi:MAG: membrane protein insertion efficiency factor YidD [Acidimicrobiia bacterium]|nr:membrane protein insertion efficiency factor YidD [Acidimicrobiia bacterium]
MSPLARGFHSLVRGYRWVMSGRPSPCRFDPSCSTYALAAIERHGARRGLWMSLRRVGRCHPWGGMGWDPVPDGKAN